MVKKLHFFQSIDHYIENLKKIIKNIKNKYILNDYIIFIKIIVLKKQKEKSKIFVVMDYFSEEVYFAGYLE